MAGIDFNPYDFNPYDTIASLRNASDEWEAKKKLQGKSLVLSIPDSELFHVVLMKGEEEEHKWSFRDRKDAEEFFAPIVQRKMTACPVFTEQLVEMHDALERGGWFTTRGTISVGLYGLAAMLATFALLIGG